MDVSVGEVMDVEDGRPCVEHDESGTSDPPYQEATVAWNVLGLERVYVLVDLQIGKLVSLELAEYTEIVFLEDNSPIPLPPGGLD